jgi:hypothetical protein
MIKNNVSEKLKMKKALQDIANIIYKHSFEGFITREEIKIFDICKEFTDKPDKTEIL